MLQAGKGSLYLRLCWMIPRFGCVAACGWQLVAGRNRKPKNGGKCFPEQISRTNILFNDTKHGTGSLKHTRGIMDIQSAMYDRATVRWCINAEKCQKYVFSLRFCDFLKFRVYLLPKYCDPQS